MMSCLVRPACLLLAIGLALPTSRLLAQADVTASMKVRRLGYLGLRPLSESQATIAALKDGLQESGWIEGRNYHLEVRLADNDPNRYPVLIAELTKLGVEVMVAVSTPAAIAIHKANPMMPIVVGGQDLVGAGLALSSERPGGVVTGVEEVNAGNTDKSLRLLKEVAPAITSVAVLSPAPTPAAHERQYGEAERSAKQLGLAIRAYRVSAATDLKALLSSVEKDRPEGLLVLGGLLPAPAIEQIVAFANSQRLPAVYPHELYAKRGGLLAYAIDTVAMFRFAATYVANILNGATPGDLPLTRWTQENSLHVNVRTAEMIGIVIPPRVMSRAARVVR